MTRRPRREPKLVLDHEIQDYLLQHRSTPDRELIEKLQIGGNRFYRLKAGLAEYEAKLMRARVKKTGSTDWRQYAKVAQERQELRREASFSQDYIRVNMEGEFGIKGPLVILPLSDLHIGSIATDYDILTEITDGILANPNVFVILNGDLSETTAHFKNALAVHSQVMNIEEQHDVVESWLEEIAPRVISCGWDNHAVEREERDGAMSAMKRLWNRRFRYHNGMGRIDIELGEHVYRLLVSHKMRGVSIFNRLHGAKRTVRLEFPDVDVAITGDYHTPAMEEYYDGQYKRLAIMAGNLKLDDGWQKRYFTLFSHSEMPCFVITPDEKEFVPFFTLDRAITYCEGLNQSMKGPDNERTQQGHPAGKPHKGPGTAKHAKR